MEMYTDELEQMVAFCCRNTKYLKPQMDDGVGDAAKTYVGINGDVLVKKLVCGCCL